jgi:hypothetical protein
MKFPSTESVARVEGHLVILHLINHSLRANGHVCVMVDLACAQAAMGHTIIVPDYA